jgi:RNA polymerase sigma factor (TIGR02999 family)
MADQNHPALPAALVMPPVYAALRRLAKGMMYLERPGHTLTATGLVHEAYLRLEAARSGRWDGPGHFYAAAAEAMRRILVERARRRTRLRHGAGLARVAIDLSRVEGVCEPPELLALDEALTRLERRDPRKADVVKLRYFAGFSIAETAHLLRISPATVKLDWAYARAWLERSIKSIQSS